MADTDSILNTAEGKVLPRLEKKARQTLAKLGLKKVEGIHRVVLRRPGNVLFVVSEPEVFRSPGSDCYIIFGEAQMQDPNSAAGFSTQAIAAAQAAQARQEAESARQAKASGGASSGEEKAGVDPTEVFDGVEEGTSKKDDEPEGEVDAAGLEESDITTVMNQGKCSRAKAVKALKDHEGDLINAIMQASD